MWSATSSISKSRGTCGGYTGNWVVNSGITSEISSSSGPGTDNGGCCRPGLGLGTGIGLTVSILGMPGSKTEKRRGGGAGGCGGNPPSGTCTGNETGISGSVLTAFPPPGGPGGNPPPGGKNLGGTGKPGGSASANFFTANWFNRFWALVVLIKGLVVSTKSSPFLNNKLRGVGTVLICFWYVVVYV